MMLKKKYHSLLLSTLAIGSCLSLGLVNCINTYAKGPEKSESRQGETNQSSQQEKSGSSQTSVDPIADACKHNPQATICQGQQRPLAQTVTDIMKVIVGLLGMIAVIIIIWAGMTYVTSAGDPGKIALAKQMIWYAILGLIVTVAAGAIVAFVVNAAK